MKWTARILIMLLLIGCTAVGCTVQETGQTQEQTLPQVQNPESTETGEPERETQTSETEPEDPYTPPVYVPAVICTDVHSGETAELSILYHERPSYTFNFTKVFSQGGAEDRLTGTMTEHGTGTELMPFQARKNVFAQTRCSMTAFVPIPVSIRQTENCWTERAGHFLPAVRN